ncbi:GroES-like protein [Lenzites betulinus]|nr:GroES-like protein [Lenzites betulinus]
MSTAKTTQKALIVPAPGAAYVVGESVIPQPGPKEILVKLHAVGLNPVDWKVSQPEFSAVLAPAYPFVPGTDGAGTVVDVGEDVPAETFKKGDRVLFAGYRNVRAYAAFQEYCTIPVMFAARIPANISFEESATVPGTLSSATLGFYNTNNEAESLALKPFWEEGGKAAYAGKPILILGGASSLGQYAIQLAHASGFKPIITTASTPNAILLTSMGATYVVDRSLPTETIIENTHKLAKGAPIEFIFDAVSLPETQTLAYKVLAPGGALAIVLPSAIPAELKKADDNKRVASVRGIVHLPQNRATGAELFKRVTQWLEQEIIQPNAFEVLPGGLAGIPPGLERLKNHQVSAKKLVVRPPETP